MKKAIILLSGGLDSSTCLAVAKSQGFDCHALTCGYGQKNSTELEAARRVADYFQVSSHRIFELPIGQFGGSALTDETIAVPDYQLNDQIPVTYVPARNTIFLSLALGLAEIIAASDIFIGVNAVDYSGYPDCRPDFIAAFQNMANLATKTGVEGNTITIQTPIIHLDKAGIIQLGQQLGMDYGLTISCYRADSAQGRACGRCDSCVLRKQGFAAAGVKDPTVYV